MAPAAWARIKGVLHGRQRSFPVFTSWGHKVPPASINCIPPEILGTIFLHLLPPFGALDNPGHIPNLLSQVCRFWRAVALALPGLWASLNITCNHRLFQPPLHIIHTHLLRSTGYPLSIVLSTDDQNSTTPRRQPSPHFSAVLDALVAARSRWRYVQIALASEATQETLDMITQGDAPLLRVFHCRIASFMVQGPRPISLRALQACPQLESLTWSAWKAPLSLGDENCARLTMLDLDAAITTSDCLTLLQLSPCLSTVSFRNIDSLGTNNSSHHILHPTVHTFHATGTHTTALIDAITFPALEDLSLNACRPTTPQTTLHAFLIRSAPPLRALFLIDLRAPEFALTRLLALTENLETLEVSESGHGCVPLTAAFIRALHPSPLRNPNPLCPRLSVLWLRTLYAPDGVCTTMLRARWGAEARNNGVASLREVRIRIAERYGHRRDQAEMHALNREGLAGMLYPYWAGQPVHVE